MARVHRAVMLRAVAAALVLIAAWSSEHVVGHALARRGAELAAHHSTQHRPADRGSDRH
ncbi:hypothetical protein [Kitasatospora viridis]|uniref:Uncharacterized protein n=1 Tax=Kitasatospora viridis TaxID=281105 RepID=A0A561UMC4_9ACTN|nr:hypothetical protein [Kitasatospora viridis]TWG00528.1 hypothetical protein FHX73_114407 [Kitasatospora viridis]